MKMTSKSEKIELLVKRIKYSPSREWVNSYFDLVKRILDVAGLKNDNPRLVMSLSSNTGWHFPVTINNRYVVALRKKKENGKIKLFVGAIFNFLSRDISQLQDKIHWQFSNLRGEFSEPPYFLRFANFPEFLYWLDTSEQVYESWREGLLAEVQRAKASPFRKSHEPIMYRMAVDVNF
jgi:5-methylcytosine-specific restriction protein A